MASEYEQIAKQTAIDNRKLKKNIHRVLELPGNDCCADCGTATNAENGWASISFGIVLCVNCAGVHRSIGGNQVRSFSLDTKTWTTTSNIEFFRKIGGNTAANTDVWEHFLSTFHINPKYDKFHSKSAQQTLRSLFIRSKYEEQHYIPSRNKTAQKQYVKKMPIDVRQTLMYFYDVETALFSKKQDYLVIHGQYISRYSHSKIKKNRCNDIFTFDLLKLKVVIDDNKLDGTELGEDEFIFMLFDDSTYIPASILHMNKGMRRIQSHTAVENEIFRIKFKGSFKDFMKIIHDIRATISYYRMYEQLVSISGRDDEPLIIMNYDLQKAVFLGIGKVFNSTKCYFFAINDTLYGLSGKKDPRNTYAVDDKCAHLNAKYGWNLNKIDILLDTNGKRTGSKFALLLILKNKTIFIKFDNGPDVVQFFTLVQKECLNTKGRYLVNFSSNPPTICGEDKKEEEEDTEKNVGQLLKVRMKSLKQESHHRKCPTQILEIISQIQIDEEKNGPVIYESEEEEDHEYVYEYMQPQNSTDLMVLPPPPNIQAASSDPLSIRLKLQQSPPQKAAVKQIPPPIPQLPPSAPGGPPAPPSGPPAPPSGPPAPPSGPPAPPSGPPAPPGADQMQQQLQERLRAEQERKQREYEEKRARKELEEKRRKKEEEERLAMERAIAEEERQRMMRELEAAKVKAAEEERKRKELEEQTKRLKEEQERERQREIERERQREIERERERKKEIERRRKIEEEKERQRQKELAVPSQINPGMQVVNGQNVVMGSPKSWEQLEQRMMNKQNVDKGRNVEEALANKWAVNNDDDDSSSASSSSDSGYGSTSDSDESDKQDNNNGMLQANKPVMQNSNSNPQQQRGSWQNNNSNPQQDKAQQRGSWQGNAMAQGQGASWQQQQQQQLQQQNLNAAKNNQQRGSWQGQVNNAPNAAANAAAQQRGSWQGQQGHQQSYSQMQMQHQQMGYNQYNQMQPHQREQSQPVNVMNMYAAAGYNPYGANKNQFGAYAAYNNKSNPALADNKSGDKKKKPGDSDIVRQQQAELAFFKKDGGSGSGSGGDRWMCKMCTFENKPSATHCDMCTVQRPKNSGFSQVLSPQQLKELHGKMTYHYQQYTAMQRLPPMKQQEMHKQMTYHYQQYSIMYKEYQKQQQKPKVVKKRKSKLVANKEMQYLKLQRIFTMNEQQKLYLSNPAKFHRIQQLFGQFARITIVPQNKCYQIEIPNNIPLPRRKDHWQQIITIIRQQIGISQEK